MALMPESIYEGPWIPIGEAEGSCQAFYKRWATQAMCLLFWSVSAAYVGVCFGWTVQRSSCASIAPYEH